MVQLLVLGGPSVDRAPLQESTDAFMGGVGIVTALAARRCGAQVTIFGLRPDPCPEWLKPVADRLAGLVRLSCQAKCRSSRVPAGTGKPNAAEHHVAPSQLCRPACCRLIYPSMIWSMWLHNPT